MYYNYLHFLRGIIADLLTIMYSLPMYPLKAVLSEINVELYSFTKIDYSVSFFLVKISGIETVGISIHPFSAASQVWFYNFLKPRNTFLKLQIKSYFQEGGAVQSKVCTFILVINSLYLAIHF